MSSTSYKEITNKILNTNKANINNNITMSAQSSSNPIKRSSQNQAQQGNTQIISGYFVKEKSYKEMVVARVNTFLCVVLALLVSVCLVSYYFVAVGEIELNKIRKATLALNYDNEEMQNKLDNLQSYHNVDKAVARTNILQRAKQVVELSAASLPSVSFDEDKGGINPRWFMSY